MTTSSSRLLTATAIGVALFLAATCGGKGGSPADPTPTARAGLAVTINNVTGERAASGYDYKFQLQLRETGGVATTVTAIAMSFFDGGTPIGVVNRTQDIPSSQIGANATATTSWTISDEDGGAYATRLQIAVTFTDTVGAQSASGSADVPPLPSGPSPPPPGPSGFIVSGTVREQGAGILADVVVAIKDTPTSTTTDGQGRYSLTGLSSGAITLRASKSGYDILEQAVNVTGNVTVDLTMRRPSGPPNPPPTIDSFTVDNNSVSLGQTTTLRWAVSNASSVSIDNGIGAVPSSGSREVQPSYQVTRYQITATGAGGTANRFVSVNVSGSMQCSASEFPAGTTAVCNNGQLSQSQNRSGTCSANGGVRCWVCPGLLCNP